MRVIWMRVILMIDNHHAATASRMNGGCGGNVSLTDAGDPSNQEGGAEMKKPLIGMMLLGCALLSGLAVYTSARAEPAREATNPAVRMALPQTFDLFGASQTTPAEAPALSFSSDEAVSRLIIDAAPLRITDAFPALDRPGHEAIRNLDLEFAISSGRPGGLELAIAPRAEVSIGPEGRTSAGAGAEVRIGQGLGRLMQADDGEDGRWYLFAATDGSALTWRPESAESGLNGLRFQEERVVVGDAQIGVSAEFSGMQASLSLVNREISNGKESTDQNFVGATLTWRR
jgi:hypothetical protein